MTRRIRRGDPEYETAMREAKALFDAAMAKSATKARGRPAAGAKPPVAAAAAADEVVLEDLDEAVVDDAVVDDAEAAPGEPQA